MAEQLYPHLPADEQHEVQVLCERLGFVPNDFEIQQEPVVAGDPRRLSVRRLSNSAQSAYEAAPGLEWIEELESDLECGLYGQPARSASA
ncbi:hypothetical protein AB4Z48_26145 [Cupriavidus sp. 2TAF22]|uniref:hypothetical protein n=1 Tax=unclassified Cupriavidus TaxID=2640874 RepID=UPI003F92629E